LPGTEVLDTNWILLPLSAVVLMARSIKEMVNQSFMGKLPPSHFLLSPFLILPHLPDPYVLGCPGISPCTSFFSPYLFTGILNLIYAKLNP
jgi:hypothetical protein